MKVRIKRQLTSMPTMEQELLSHSEFAFIPISDAGEDDQYGSHWSFILLVVRHGVAFHYDSYNALNKSVARDTANKLGQVLEKNIRFLHCKSTPPQHNTYDCGVMVCWAMGYLIRERLLPHGDKANFSLGGLVVNTKRARAIIRKCILQTLGLRVDEK